jgi:hypothetical protein
LARQGVISGAFTELLQLAGDAFEEQERAVAPEQFLAAPEYG